ncbi:hypothetical protein FN976_24360 [Caenimonas sedimenti]|uniref:DUF3368 domain-containing protein n=1 Tax=Caenimonas sedimenti TaxID=2596921 RepID=A0A562ZHT4_9BURK|nr:hypothetical protein [Caenimonas sedimenti]TWO68073.1 hypothetical protein FN976_24360 [Caenimonas sedimenti]
MSNRIKIVVPDAGPINTLAAAGKLELLLAPSNTDVVMIESVVNEILVRAPELQAFFEQHAARIKRVATSVCVDDRDKAARGLPIGKGRGDLAIADFIMNFIDEAVGNAPALVIFEDKKLGRLRTLEQYSANTHFITTAAYLRKLEAEGIITSFDETWSEIVSKSHSSDPRLHREPNPQEIDAPAGSGSSVFRMRER